MRAYVIAVFCAIVVVAVAHGHDGKADTHEEVVAHLKPEPTAHSDRIGEGSFGFPLNADGSVPHTNGKITMTITAACTTNDIIPTLDQGNRMSCHAGNRMSQTSCTQSSTTKPGYYDYTNFAAILACGSNAWVESLQLYSKYQLWFDAIGHTADLSLVGRVPNWNGNVGDYMVFKMTGTPQSNQAATCEMEAGVQLHLCNTVETTSWANAANTNLCKCVIDGAAGPLILLDQGAKLTSGTMQNCGKWFIGASSTITMLVGNLRSYALQKGPLMERCVLGKTCTDTPGWTNNGAHGCANYENDGFCADGQFKRGKWHGSGAAKNYPENNCCVCGKTPN